MKTKTLCKLKHGSHLYNLATLESDFDYYEVYDFLNQRYRPRKQSKQTITDDTDEMYVSLERFHSLCVKGVPQALEVLYAPEEAFFISTEEWESKVPWIRYDVFDNLEAVLETYRRTAKNFMAKDNFKRNRHAARLIINACQLKSSGTMNPVMYETNIPDLNAFASLPYSERVETFKRDWLWQLEA